ncbi:MAG: hypothetical protein K0S04_3576, partial [Herbinix sp.]|nr:hypothetical protein [Herbinix sp.]
CGSTEDGLVEKNGVHMCPECIADLLKEAMKE